MAGTSMVSRIALRHRMSLSFGCSMFIPITRSSGLLLVGLVVRVPEKRSTPLSEILPKSTEPVCSAMSAALSSTIGMMWISLNGLPP